MRQNHVGIMPAPDKGLARGGDADKHDIGLTMPVIVVPWLRLTALGAFLLMRRFKLRHPRVEPEDGGI